VKDERLDPEPVAPLELFGQGGGRFLAEIGISAGGVDEIRRVGDDRGEAGVADRGPKPRSLLVVDLFADPAVRVLDENLENAACAPSRPLDGVGRSPRNRLMRAERKVVGSVPRRAAALLYDGSGLSRSRRISSPIRRETKICFK
jgi:hypothetical protein